VQAGQQIGIAGCSGWCTGTHLHFELRYRGLPVDPTLLIAS
jgi:murein DD-endopeptidase MepM/ murein hydrolase activator NlpD